MIELHKLAVTESKTNMDLELSDYEVDSSHIVGIDPASSPSASCASCGNNCARAAREISDVAHHQRTS